MVVKTHFHKGATIICQFHAKFYSKVTTHQTLSPSLNVYTKEKSLIAQDYSCMHACIAI